MGLSDPFLGILWETLIQVWKTPFNPICWSFSTFEKEPIQIVRISVVSSIQYLQASNSDKPALQEPPILLMVQKSRTTAWDV